MKTVVMRQQMSGGRHDGQPWPNFGEEISVPDWEADELVAGGIAGWPKPKPETREEKPPAKAKPVETSAPRLSAHEQELMSRAASAPKRG